MDHKCDHFDNPGNVAEVARASEMGGSSDAALPKGRRAERPQESKVFDTPDRFGMHPLSEPSNRSQSALQWRSGVGI